MPSTATTIQSARLDMIPMTPEFLQASLDGDLAAAAAVIGLTIPTDWLEEPDLMRIRLDQLRADPSLQPWLLRAIGLRSERLMIGHIGFHTRPGAAYLADLAPGGVEFGYTVFARFRRQGYAREAAHALMGWAAREQGVPRFVVSISPQNLPSLGLAQQLGFQRIGSHVDEEDGPEDIFELRVAAG
ncbi:MAG: GNAT family N-acetyltransferase [Roseiflexaceae bacterium]